MRDVRTVRREVCANLSKKFDKAAFSYSTKSFSLSQKQRDVFRLLYGLKAVFVNKDRTPKISPEYPVTNTPRSGLVRDSYKCGEDAIKNPLDSRI